MCIYGGKWRKAMPSGVRKRKYIDQIEFNH
jgi:hypothetical protein